ncbi:MAG: type I-E CRISPR-associated protein Cse2/CasB [Methanomicrobium sp.]|nr:type I-E CRISPR-associated protein Cse2/CasB [Methanomicrobium sp.]
MNETDSNTINGALDWWKTIRPGSKHDSYKGERAELRRCHSTTDVMFIPSYHLLLEKTNADKNNSELLHQLAAIAWVLSWVDEETDTDFAKSLANTDPQFSQIRFRRLLASDNWDDLGVQLIRALKFTKRRANVSDIIKSILRWKRGSARENWALSYYGSVKEE